MKLFRNKKKFGRLRYIAIVLAAIVVFTTTYSLILPALTLETTEAETTPGIVLEESEDAAEVSAEVDDITGKQDAVESSETEPSAADVDVQTQAANQPAEQAAEKSSEKETAAPQNLPAPETASKPEAAASVKESSKHSEKTPALFFAAEIRKNGAEVKAEGLTDEEAEKVSSYYNSTSQNSTKDMILKVTAEAKEGAFPAGTTMKVKEVSKDKAVLEKAADALDGVVRKFQAVDISFYDKDGKEIEPAKDIRITITSDTIKEEKKENNETPVIVHVPDTGKAEVVNAIDEKTLPKEERPADDEVMFENDAFSVYVIAYTVDFEYEVDGNVYQFSLPGGGKIALSELIEVLGILQETKFEGASEFLADIKAVEFSNPQYLDVEKITRQSSYQVLTPDESGQAAVLNTEDGSKAYVPLSRANDAWTTVYVQAGDYLLTSLASFNTEEKLTIMLNDDTEIIIHVTDPVASAEDLNRNGNGTWNLQDVAGITVTYDTSVETNEQERDTTINFKIAYEFNEALLTYLKGVINTENTPGHVSYPTFEYDLSSMLQGSDLANTIAGHNYYLSTGTKRVGTLQVGTDGKVTLQITDLNWFLGRNTLKGSFELDLEIDETEAENHDKTSFTFPGTDHEITVNFKTNITTEQKTLDATDNGDGTYTLKYAASVTSPADMTDLQFVDTISGLQKLDAGSVKVNGAPVSVTQTDNGFTYDFPKNGEGKVKADTYKIEYTTTVSAADYNTLGFGASSWETNHADWKVNGNKTIPGGDTSYEIKKPVPDPPTINKSSSKDGQKVNPGDEITYTIELSNEGGLAGLTISDNMTDLQYLTGTRTVTVDVADRSDLVETIFAAYNNDSSYSSGSTQVINYTFPDDFTGKSVKITYTTKVIDQETAAANSVYDLQVLANNLSENWTWQNKQTNSTVEYEKEVETSVSKTASVQEVTGEDGQTYKVITYTITFGDGTTLLDGVKARDVMSGNQEWILGSFAMTGNGTGFNWAPEYQNSPSQWETSVFDFTFPEGTGKGPVVITYQTRTLSDAIANENGIYGNQTLTNKVTGGTGHDETGVDHHYKDEPKMHVEKTVKQGGDDKNGQTVAAGSTVHYEITFGDGTMTIDSIMDEMTDIQKLSSPVTVTLPDTIADGTYTMFNGKTITVSGHRFTMPTASGGWDRDGVAWDYFDDDTYSQNETVRVFNFAFSELKDKDGNVIEIKGPVKVEYDCTIITETEAGNSGITGEQTARNTAISGNNTSTVTVKPNFPTNPNHNPAFEKSFDGWDDDGYTTWWKMRITADPGDSTADPAVPASAYPLTGLTLTEEWANNNVWYSTEWPVQNYRVNAVSEIDLLGAVITTDSGVVLQAGQDYTIDKAAGSFYFPELTEGITIRIAIHNPDATINTFYQYNKARLNWQKDQWNVGEITDDAECRRETKDIDVTKTGSYDESSRVISWTVILNPYKQTIEPDWATVAFTDQMPAGLELVDNKITVMVDGTKASYYSYDLPATVAAGGTITVPDISCHYAHDYNLDDEYGVGTGLSGTRYTVTYQTRIPDEKWNEITSSLTGSETIENHATFSDGGTKTFDATSSVTVESDNYLKKYDETLESSDGFVLNVNDNGEIVDAGGKVYTADQVAGLSSEERQNLGIYGNQILYRIEVNPDANVLNSGKALTLTDRIDTNMELDTTSVKIYRYTSEGSEEQEYKDGTAVLLTDAEISNLGISISYNDDTRYFSISGIPDATHYRVTYRTTVRAVGEDTFTNTATLIGGGSHSDSTTENHSVQKSKITIEGSTSPKIHLKKIDQNMISKTLTGAKFELYECTLATDTSSFSRDDWLALLDDVDGRDPAIIARIMEEYKIVSSKKINSGTSDGGGSNEDAEGFLTFDKDSEGKYLKEHTLYYWIETEAPDGYTGELNVPHYFVLYNDGETNDEYTNEDDHKKAAWALDDACQFANGITVASMPSETTWTVTNTQSDKTSISVTKKWEGDFDDNYETRPKDGILFDLYRINADGTKTLMEDLSPVAINANTYIDSEGKARTYWTDYTWYALDAKYKYTVEEHSVDGYLTTYSDNQEGVSTGTITVTNTYIPKNTEINVEKKWEPENGTKPDQILVSLYQIVRIKNEDGTITVKPAEPSGYTGVLTAGNNWKYGWKGLPTTDPDGNTVTYTVVEDVDAMKEAGFNYGPIYSDNGEGVVSAPADDPLVITNVENAPGSLKITKNVTVNGQTVTDTAADGTYIFRITNLDGTPATYMHDHLQECLGGDEKGTVDEERHNAHLVGNIMLTVQNGRSVSTLVDNLEAGTYTVTEVTPTNGTSVVGNSSVQVTVKAGVTKDSSVEVAEFTNNIDKTRVEVSKEWTNADGSKTWPSGLEVQVTLKKTNGTTKEVVTTPAAFTGKAWSAVQYLSSVNKTYLWDDLDELPDGSSYIVEETGIRESGDETVTSVTNGYVTIAGKTYSVSGGEVDGGKATLQNTEYTDVVFTKQWGVNGNEEWPSGVTITVQLKRDGEAEGTPVVLGATASDDATAITNQDGVYTYTWEKLPANHTYTVEETDVSSEDYLSITVDGTTVKNIKKDTSITVEKKWKTGETETGWPEGVNSVSATLMRRLAKKLVDGEWVNLAAAEYPYEEFNIGSSKATVTINKPDSGNTGTANVTGLDQYALMDGVLYEYAYSVKEENVQAGYTSAVTGQGTNTITITNTEVQEGKGTVSLKKIFKDANGNILSSGQLPDGVTPSFTLKRYVTEGGGGNSGEYNISVEVGNSFGYGTLLNGVSTKADTQITINYKAVSHTYPNGGNPYTNQIKINSANLYYYGRPNENNNITWWHTASASAVWSADGESASITFTIPTDVQYTETKELRILLQTGSEVADDLLKAGIGFDGGGSPQPDNWTGTIKTYPDGGSWVTEGSDTYWKADFGTVQLTDGDKTYTYYVEESGMPTTEGYSVSYSVGSEDATATAADHRLGDTGTVTITNTVPAMTEVEVNKVWADGNGNHTNDTATVELYKVRTDITPEPDKFHLTVQIPETSYRPTSGGNVKVSLYGPKNGLEGQWLEDIEIPGNGVWTATSTTELSADGNYTLSIADNAANTTNTYWDSNVYASKPTLDVSTITGGSPTTVNVLTQAKSSGGSGEGNVTVINWGSTVPQNKWAQIKINNIFWATGSPDSGFNYGGTSGKEQELTHHWEGDTSKDSDSVTISPDAQYNSSDYQYMVFHLQPQEFSASMHMYITCVGGKAYKKDEQTEITSSTPLGDCYVVVEKSVTQITISLEPPSTTNALNRLSAPFRAPALAAATPATYTGTGYNAEPTAQTGLNVPDGAVKVDTQILNSGTNGWDYKWTGLPTTETEGGKTYALTYYVKESLVHSDADSVSSSYTYVYNTAGDSSSGVKIATITNTPTYSGGLKIVKTFEGIPADEAETDLTQTEPYKNLSFTITGPNSYNNSVNLSDFTRVETTDDQGNVRYSYEYVVANTGLKIGDVYSVSESNATGLVANYTLVSSSVTSGSGSVPQQAMGSVNLVNKYEPIKGSITVTKKILLNGEAATDDVAPGQRFRIGLEYRSAGSADSNAWTIVTNDDGKPWIETLVIGEGATASTTFNNLALGQYRAFEIPDSITNTDTLSTSAIYAAITDGTITINNIEWKVSSTGVYYDYNHGESTERVEHDVSDDTGTEDVVVISSDEGGYGDVAPRHAEITIKNDKTETGSITVNKLLLYNGEPDSTKLDAETSWWKDLLTKLGITFAGTEKTIKVGLYSDASAELPVKETADPEKNVVKTITIATEDDRATSDVDETGRGSVTFTDLPYGTYYVFELDDAGNPVKGAEGTFFGLPYTVAGDNGAKELNHSNPSASASFTNSYRDAKFKIVKVDSTDANKKLPGAEFTMTMLDASATNGSYKTKTGSQDRLYEVNGTTSQDEDKKGEVVFDKLPSGYYEVRETKSPDGYIQTGGSTFYIKVDNGSVLLIQKQEGKTPDTWPTITQTDMIKFVGGSQAVITVANEPGVALPSTGGFGTNLFTIIGLGLILCAGLSYCGISLRRRRVSIDIETAEDGSGQMSQRRLSGKTLTTSGSHGNSFTRIFRRGGDPRI